MAFSLSHRSLAVLMNVHPDLQKLTARALALSPLDFVVIQGLRTPDDEAKDVAEGLSQTNHSRHLTGHAIDFMALVENKPCWVDDDYDGPLHLHPYTQIAEAFRQAAVELNIAINWGGAWNCLLNQQPSAGAAQAAYVSERKAQGGSPFLDIDHIQLDWKAYP